MQLAMGVSNLSTGSAEGLIVPDEGWRVALVRPRVAAPMHVHITEFLVSEEASKSAHDAVVEI